MLTTKRKIEPKQKKNKKKNRREAETMRKSTFKVNWASRLLGRKWKWKRTRRRRIWGPFWRFFVFSFVSRSQEAAQTDGRLFTSNFVHQGRFTFVCLFLWAHLLFFFSRFFAFFCLLVGVKLAKRGPRHCERGPSTNQITLTHKLYVSWPFLLGVGKNKKNTTTRKNRKYKKYK